MRTRLCFGLAVILTLLSVLTGCGSGGNQDVDVAIAVALTQTAAAAGQSLPTLAPATLAPVPLATATLAPAPLASATPLPPVATATVGPTNTPLPVGCTNDIKFVADVTVADRSVITPGGVFTKIWRVKNNGTCTWNTSYRLVFASGHQMNGPGVISIAGSVAPGTEYDISANLVAPTQGGEYRGFWQIVDGNGGAFGQVYAWIVVPGTPTSTPSAAIDLWADVSNVKTGECTTIHWKVDNVQAVFFRDNGVPGSGSEKVCPTKTETYELRVQKRDGSTEVRQIKIEVVANTATPSVRQQGSSPLFAAVNGTATDAYLNLDNGVRGDAAGSVLSSTDVRLVLSGGSQLYYLLEPVNGAAAKVMGTTEPGYQGCKQAEGTYATGNIPEVTPGVYICFRTNKNRYSQVRVESVEAITATGGSVRLGFITWE